MERRTFLQALAAVPGASLLPAARALAALPAAKITRVRIYRPQELNQLFNQSNIVVTVETDIYNFGATLYWALTGSKVPTLFTLKRTENSFLLDHKIPSPAELNPLVPEQLSNLVMECVRTNPAKRPHGMRDVGLRLEIIQHVLKKKHTSSGMQPALV